MWYSGFCSYRLCMDQLLCLLQSKNMLTLSCTGPLVDKLCKINTQKNGLSGFLSSRLFIFLKFLVTSANIALPINQSVFFVKHLRSWTRPLSVIWHVVTRSTHWAKLAPSQFFVINEQRSKILSLEKHIPFLACLSIISIFSCFCFSDSLLPPVSSQEKTPSWGFVFEPNLCSLLVFKLNRGRHSWSAPSNLQTYFMS